MTKSMREPVLRARIALARAHVQVQGKPANLADFIQSVRTTFADLSVDESTALHARHRLSMRKFSMIKDHLATLDPADLATFIDRHVSVEGLEHLDSVKAHGGPLIFITPHYGYFPAGCLKLGKEIGNEKTVNELYGARSKEPAGDGYEGLFRGSGYGFNAPLSQANVSTFRPLQPGEIVTTMPDIFDTKGEVLYVPFLGRLIPAKACTAILALKSDATIIVGYSRPGEGLHSTLKLGAPLKLEHTSNHDDDVARLTAAIFRELEVPILHAPEHWIYLEAIGELVEGLLALGKGDASDWLASLDAASSQINAVLPEWSGTLREIREMHVNQEHKKVAAGTARKPAGKVDKA